MRITHGHRILVAATLIGLSIFASCRKTSSDKPSIAIVVSTLNNPWFVVLADTAKQRAEELGYRATVFDSQNNTDKEAAHFENIIAGGYKAILFNPTDADGSISNVRQGKGRRTCRCFASIAKSTPTMPPRRKYFPTAIPAASHWANTLSSKWAKKGQYAELLGILGDNNTHNRSKGFHSVVDRYPGLKMVAQQTAGFDRTMGLEVMETILQAHPDINAVFCGNDAMAMGAYQAITAAGKADRVKVFGFDGADDVVRLIAEQKIAATGMQFPKTMARTGVDFADQWLKGKRDFPAEGARCRGACDGGKCSQLW